MRARTGWTAGAGRLGTHDRIDMGMAERVSGGVAVGVDETIAPAFKGAGVPQAGSLGAGIVLAALTAGLATPAGAAELHVSHQWPTHDMRHQVVQMLADELAAADVGLDLRIHPASTLMGPDEQYDALSDGRLDLAVMPLAYAAPKRPEYALTLMPGLARNHAHAERLAASDFMDGIEAILARDGIEVLVHGFLAGGLAGRDGCVSGPDDARGLKVRAAAGGVFADTLAAAGATPVALSAPEIYDALQTGAIDAASASSVGFAQDRLFEQVSCYTAPGERAPSLVYQPVLVSARTRAALDPAQAAALERASARAQALYRDEAEREDRRSVEAFRGAGVPVREMLPEEFEAWRALARDAARPLVERSAEGARLLDLALSVD